MGRLIRFAGRPARAVALAFALLIVLGTGVLMLPVATPGAGGAPFSTALFTSTSAVTVSSGTVVDTATYWSTFGQATIIVLVQIGGLGILTGAALLFLVVARRLGLRTRLIAQAETPGVDLGDLRRILRAVGVLALVVEALATLLLSLRLWLSYDYSVPSSLWRGLYLAIGAFCNAGFSLWSDNFERFATDAWMSLTVALTIIVGGLGVPVWLDVVRRDRHPRRFTLHTKLTLWVSAALLVLGTVLLIAFEWDNESTLGAFSVPGRLVAGFFSAVSPRSAGFSSVDYGAMEPESILSVDGLMFIGTASGSTGGGIKVTTFALLLLMVLAELRGEPEVTAFRRQVAAPLQRQAVSIMVISAAAVGVATLAIAAMSAFGLSDALFEAISAFGTVGLSIGGTGSLPDSCQAILIVLMYLGRVGPLTLGVALALRERRRLYRFPEERPLVG